jgi:hypothetical protein
MEIEQSQECFRGNLDFWFIRMDNNQINQFEAALIDCFGPTANRVSGIRARVGPGVPA